MTAAPPEAASPSSGPWSFDALYRAEQPRLVRLAALITGSSSIADDLVQDAFAKLHVRWAAVDDPPAWLHRAVVNASRNDNRNRATRWRVLGRLRPDSATLDEPVHELIASLRRLPATQRSVVVLRFYEDLPEAEIARVLGIRPGTVKSALHRALARLREELD